MPDPAPPPAAAPVPSAPVTVAIGDFRKLDLRIGKIVSAEDHPNADKLYVLRIDIGGGETRQIVAGVKEFVPRDSLPGKSVVVLCNLPTAKLRGVESQGMMLAATGGGTIAVLSPQPEVPTGSKVS